MIDAESLKELFPDNEEGLWTYNATAKAYIDAQPTIQPEIIRCKDCKYYKYGICMKIGANKSFHGFCDWAERREK